MSLVVRRSGLTGVLLAACLVGACVSPEWGARAIVRPVRRPVNRRPSIPFRPFAFHSQGLRLKGWRFPTSTQRRGVVVYLHGIADNRQSAIGIAQRLGPLGYDVIPYDGRAHGRSDGRFCTYGYYEKGDLVRALDALGERRVVLLGHSLGAAIALQAAAIEPRVIGVIAASTFADLPSIVEDRAPWFVPESDVQAALRRAGEIARFIPSEASPLLAAPHIHVPVALLHGGADRETRPRHSWRVYDRLTCDKELRIFKGIGHDEILGVPAVWVEIDAFLAPLPF
jgi:alpha-beta hydrolase superfamily lysophospholipase